MENLTFLKQNDDRREVLNKLETALKKIPTTKRSFLVGVSGGVDSIVLLDALIRSNDSLGICVEVAHVNHGLREESYEEEEFVSSFCKKNGIVCHIKRLSRSREDEPNTELWARNHRYSFFNSLISERNLEWVLTAHHKNDLVETFLFRVLNGRAACDARTISQINWKKNLFRPFLHISKEEIKKYANFYKLKFFEDSSNDELDKTRNKIRHDLIPKLIEDYNPNLITSIHDLSLKNNIDEDFLFEEARKIHNSIVKLNCDSILEIHPSLRWRVIKEEIIKQLGDEAGKVGYTKLKLIEEKLILKNTDPKKVVIQLGFGFAVSIAGRKPLKFLKMA